METFLLANMEPALVVVAVEAMVEMVVVKVVVVMVMRVVMREITQLAEHIDPATLRPKLRWNSDSTLRYGA